MKKVPIQLVCVLIVFTTIFRTTHAQELKESYDRSALTIVFTKYPGQFESYFSSYHDKASELVPDKFFTNPVLKGTYQIHAAHKMDSEEAKARHLADLLEKENAGAEIVKYWFNYDKDEGFNLKRLFERAEYNATDEDVLVSRASKRGEARIRDFGSKLVPHSYILVIDLLNIGKVDKETEKSPYGWEARMGYYLYKLKFGDEDITKVYNNWIFEDDPDSVRQEKLSNIGEMQFDLELATSKNNILVTGMNYLTALEVEQSYEELFEKLIQSSVTTAINKASDDLPSFRVQTKVYRRHPLMAKIGKKEGLKVDHQYFVYEYVWDDTEGKAVPKRKAVIRAKSVRDNRHESTGTSLASTFYQTYGGTVREGMTLQEKRSLGLSVAASYVEGGLGGYRLRAFFRTGPFTGVPSLYVVGGAGFDNGEYSSLTMNSTQPEDLSFFRWNVGLGKGFRIARFIEFIPYGTFGAESVDVDDVTYATYYLKGGVYGGISLLHNVMIFGDINMIQTLGAMEKVNDEFESIDMDWDELFFDENNEGREGGMGIELGLRIEF